MRGRISFRSRISFIINDLPRDSRDSSPTTRISRISEFLGRPCITLFKKSPVGTFICAWVLSFWRGAAGCGPGVGAAPDVGQGLISGVPPGDPGRFGRRFQAGRRAILSLQDSHTWRISWVFRGPTISFGRIAGCGRRVLAARQRVATCRRAAGCAVNDIQSTHT